MNATLPHQHRVHEVKAIVEAHCHNTTTRSAASSNIQKATEQPSFDFD